MTLRTKFVAVFAVIVTVGVGTTGGVLVLRHERHDAQQVVERQRLIASNAAFALKENLSIISRELWRLSRLPEVDPQDNDPAPEKALLHGAHENSVFFTSMRVLDGQGHVTLAQPASAEAVGKDYSSAPFFADARRADRPFFYVMAEDQPRSLGVAAVVPIRHEGRFDGAIQGVLDLRPDHDKVLTPELLHMAGQGGELAIVDRAGRVVFPPDGAELAAHGWESAFREVASGRAGTLHVGDYLYAYASESVGELGVVFRWPWRALHAELRREVEATAAILVVGMVLAGLFGAFFASLLVRPLVALGEIARQIAAGNPHGGATSIARDELGDLYRAFDHMEKKLGERDAKIREDVATIRSLNATLAQRVELRTHELEQAQRQLVEQERFAAMGKTAAAIAHEVKNALNGLGMCVDLVLSDTPATSASMRVRAQIHQEIARLRDVTESLLTFSRTPRIERADHDIHALIDRAVEVVRESLDEGQVTLSRALWGGGAPLRFACDGYKLQGVIINLLKNAIESLTTSPLDLSGTPPASPTAADRHITIETRRDRGELTIAVVDSGPGLTDEAHQRLFEPFYTTKVTGTGLGLATARRVIEAHGGHIEAERRATGARFEIHVPDLPQEVSLSRAL